LLQIDRKKAFSSSKRLSMGAVAALVRGDDFDRKGSRQDGCLENGKLVRVLEDWCPPFQAITCHPSRRQPSPAFALLVEALRYRA
jgi:DNA-binding transcriptional LysR family regulator